MAKIILAMAFTFLSISMASATTLEQKKVAFLSGFMGENVSGEEIRTEFSRYQSSPEKFVSSAEQMFKKTTSPVLTVVFQKEVDQLGRIVIYPELRYLLMSPEIYPNAAYMYSILDFQKDAAKLFVSPSAVSSTKKTPAIYEVQ